MDANHGVGGLGADGGGAARSAAPAPSIHPSSSINGGGDTATVSIKDGTTAQKGAVQLIETLNGADNTMACTGKAVASYAVPMDLSSLPSLEDA